MANNAVLDNDNRVQLPEEAREWFRPGTQFSVERDGEKVTLKPLNGLAAHLAAVEAAGREGELTLEEISREVKAHRTEKAPNKK